MSEISDDLLKQLWQQQPVEREVLTAEAIRKKLARLDRYARFGKLGAAIAVTMFALIVVAFIATDSLNSRRLVGYGLAFVVSVWSLWVLRKRGKVELEGVDRDLVSFVDYAITVHQRQLDMGVSSSVWRSVVLRPSILASLIGLYVVVRLTSADWTLAAFVVAIIAISQWLGFRGRRILQKEIESLKTLRDSIVSTQ